MTENLRSAESGETIERRSHPQTEPVLWQQRAKDALLMAALFAAIGSSVGFMLGPVFGKRIADDSRDTLRQHETRLAQVDSVNGRQSDSLQSLSTAVTGLTRQQGSSIYMQCAMYRSMFPRTPAPEICGEGRRE